MSLLEDRYRWVLRLLPASYREGREEEMVAAFLEGSPGAGDDARPRWPEVASVAALAVRVRLGGPSSTARSAAWGQAVRLAATFALAYWAVLGVAFAISSLVDDVAGPGSRAASPPDGAAWPWSLAAGLSPLLWAAAFAALALARPRLAKEAAALALVLHVALGVAVLARAPHGDLTDLVPPTWPLGAATVLLLGAGFHRDAPRERLALRTPAVAVASVGLVFALLPLASGLAVLASGADPRVWASAAPLLDPPGLACLGLVAAGVAYVRGRLSSAGTHAAAVPVALAILTVPVLPARADALNLSVADPVSRAMTLIAACQLAVVVVCGAALAVLGARALPPVPARRAAESG
ncbi:hypothetical protein [Microbispora sp. ATCC PTA-5024]|uniref:hypothetical protein n=1 Tax=Microbispora sp. ATCC PTA-5024 TaxID=316330 RepID=UPI0003DC4A1B|nr:hypothetical protein [Microbispora sp. ATCC PTA-5024]ETK38090.1 hypothetical protein MPTA5024_00585 [Microbispora sp. ATCC PTA-5024]